MKNCIVWKDNWGRGFTGEGNLNLHKFKQRRFHEKQAAGTGNWNMLTGEEI
jgi:hypothetical protein